MAKNLKKPESSYPENGPDAAAVADEDVRESPLPLGGDFSLSPPAEEGEAPKRRGRPPGSGDNRGPRSHKKGSGIKAQAAAAATAAAADKPADPALIATCLMGVTAITALAEQHAEFSNPGDEWRQTMAELSARWLMKLENVWLQTHPLEAQILLHLSVYLVPNVLMFGGRIAAKYVKPRPKLSTEGQTDEEAREAVADAEKHQFWQKKPS